MRPVLKRTLALAVTLALLAAAAVASELLRSRQTQAQRDELTQTAEAARDQAQAVLVARLAAVQEKAISASSLPVLRAQIGVVDAQTLRDGFATEPWWLPIRQEYPVYGLSLGGTIEMLSGASPAELDVSALLKTAAARRSSSAIIASGDSALFLAAALIDKPGDGPVPVLLLAKPLDAALLAELAASAKAALAITYGKRLLLSAGPETEQRQLNSALGSERAGTSLHKNFASSCAQLGGALLLCAHSRPTTLLPTGAPLDVIAIWAGAGLASLLVLFFGFRRAAQDGSRELLPEEAPGLTQAVASSGQVAATATGRSNPALRAGSTGRSNPAVRAGATSRSDPGRRSTNLGKSRTNSGTTGSGTTGPGSTLVSGAAKGPVVRPKKFGRYYLLNRLGEGGMAEVYTAVAFGAENFRRHFVVKLLRADAVRTEALVHMFIDEAKLASSLIHSNIIPVFDFGKMGDEYFMAQEYILGRDLRAVTKRAIKVDGKPLDPRFSLFIARETLNALEYAHTRMGQNGPLGIVHRDVSPNNILISARGEVKLFDFGIAKADEGRLHQTQTGVVKGNVSFMAPEQARGEMVDRRADVAALGLVLYYALTGTTLYEGDTSYQLLVKAAMGLTPEVAVKLNALPPELADALRLALEVDREQRFQSAAAFERALSILPMSSGGELAREMQRLFAVDLQVEESQFASVEPPPDEEGEAQAPQEPEADAQAGEPPHDPLDDTDADDEPPESEAR